MTEGERMSIQASSETRHFEDRPVRRRRPVDWLADHPGYSRLLIVVAFLLLWEVLARAFGDPLFVAAPSQVIAGLRPLLATAGVPEALWVTTSELAFAFFLSIIIGVTLGLWLGLGPFANRSFMPIVLLLYATPQATIIPIFMMIFGIGPASKVAYGFSHGVFPIIVTVAAGVRNINPVLLVASRSMGARRSQVLRHVVLPHLVPSLFTGMRLGMTATLLGVILAELYASVSGVGYFSRQYAQSFKPAELFGLIAIVAAIAIALNELLRVAEKRLTAWRRAQR
jgi:ABC-type nitrate/sulfonate/bicarbonate transport system permease component